MAEGLATRPRGQAEGGTGAGQMSEDDAQRSSGQPIPIPSRPQPDRESVEAIVRAVADRRLTIDQAVAALAANLAPTEPTEPTRPIRSKRRPGVSATRPGERGGERARRPSHAIGPSDAHETLASLLGRLGDPPVDVAKRWNRSLRCEPDSHAEFGGRTPLTWDRLDPHDWGVTPDGRLAPARPTRPSPNAPDKKRSRKEINPVRLPAPATRSMSAPRGKNRTRFRRQSLTPVAIAAAVSVGLWFAAARRPPNPGTPNPGTPLAGAPDAGPPGLERTVGRGSGRAGDRSGQDRPTLTDRLTTSEADDNGIGAPVSSALRLAEHSEDPHELGGPAGIDGLPGIDGLAGIANGETAWRTRDDSASTDLTAEVGPGEPETAGATISGATISSAVAAGPVAAGPVAADPAVDADPAVADPVGKRLAITPPSAGAEIVLFEADSDELSLEFPFATTLRLRGDDRRSGWRLVDGDDPRPIATIRVRDGMMRWIWQDSALSSDAARTIAHGRFRTGGTIHYVRPVISAEPVPISLGLARQPPSWDLSPPIRPSLARVRVQIEVPEDVGYEWVRPLPDGLSRRSSGLVRFEVAGDQQVSLAAEIRPAWGRRFRLEVRFAARSDPAGPWQIVTAAGLEATRDRLAEESAGSAVRMAAIDAAYARAGSAERTRMRPTRDAIRRLREAQSEQIRRLQVLETLLQRLQADGTLTPFLDIAWPDNGLQPVIGPAS